ncbi:hypothetical protein [Methylobacillus flagellatus]|uniref:hypothetical protein n=1 Tax=Methylobacillus flagellatus TaxID=405 RepID=UPI0006626FDA|nr:hypothetical protein [Methylobacillus flagellatus]
MKINRQFMKQKEFKERQLWLDFECATGIALQAISEDMEKARAWFKRWVKGFKTRPSRQRIEQEDLFKGAVPA